MRLDVRLMKSSGSTIHTNTSHAANTTIVAPRIMTAPQSGAAAEADLPMPSNVRWLRIFGEIKKRPGRESSSGLAAEVKAVRNEAI